jgi:hypothetical protein
MLEITAVSGVYLYHGGDSVIDLDWCIDRILVKGLFPTSSGSSESRRSEQTTHF